MACISACLASDTQTPSKEGELDSKWKLVWSDEFDYTGLPDTNKWSYEVGYIRNNELQYYTESRLKNARVEEGKLIIETHKEQYKDFDYTSASVISRGKGAWLYGRIEIRAKLPGGKGIWPALWMLPENKKYDWPKGGEIDIMEYYRIKGVPHILANAAWGTDRQWNAKWNSKAIPFTHFTDKDPAWADKFHIWRMDWDETAIKIYLDDELLNEIPLSETVNGTIGKGTNPFRKPQYLLLNLALGGINGGEIDDKGIPMRYEIDYVRVYQKQ